jgi:hypothetical protein
MRVHASRAILRAHGPLFLQVKQTAHSDVSKPQQSNAINTFAEGAETE